MTIDYFIVNVHSALFIVALIDSSNSLDPAGSEPVLRYAHWFLTAPSRIQMAHLIHEISVSVGYPALDSSPVAEPVCH